MSPVPKNRSHTQLFMKGIKLNLFNSNRVHLFIIFIITLLLLANIAFAQVTESLTIDEAGNTKINGDLSVTGSSTYGGWPNSYPYIMGTSLFMLDAPNYCWGYLPTETAKNGHFCGDDLDVVFFNSYSLGFLGKDLKLHHGFNSSVHKYGYADMFFLENIGGSTPLKLPLGSCNDVAIFIGTGTVSRGDGGNWSLVYHRTPSPTDGGAGCPCDDNLNPILTVPSGKFRLAVVTRGSSCTGYVVMKPFSWKSDLKVDWEGYRKYNGQF